MNGKIAEDADVWSTADSNYLLSAQRMYQVYEMPPIKNYIYTIKNANFM